MTLNEFAVLDALNIASCQQPAPGEDFWGTAAGVAEVLSTDDRFKDYPKLDARACGYVLRGCMSRINVHAPLVEQVGRRHGGALKWRLTRAACQALIA